ncbi:hypothetical protein CEY16_08770 [Halalkalibacillus sediminis]|uniref:PDZ domain-containing protein n=1 Tax=Halalkalibacillus sediminis TaxID=2018042 RepID=A0A2I0QUH7_9BACI|nr:PDZ domain-containing protein [Halalkalibacillus sediminis]PKR78003.1 hypothetical protein CEY16_08770 [Halalkalibacillus sediminis]
MAVEWLKEIGFGFLWLFVQPLLYLAIAYSFWTGYRRIKKDRRQFGHRVFSNGFEWKNTWWLGVLLGLLLSVGLVASGGFLNYTWVLMLSCVVLILMLVNQVALLSPVYTIGIAGAITFSLAWFGSDFLPNELQDEVVSVDVIMVSYLLIALLITEGLLFLKSKRNHSFPMLHKGKRGKYIASHTIKKLMVVPLMVPIPGGVLELSPWLGWWPVFDYGGDGFGLMLIPFIIGASQRFQGVFSDIGAKKVGKSLLLFSLILVGGAVAVFFYPSFAIALIGVAFVGRILIHLIFRSSDLEKRPIFTPQTDGILIVGITPGSPADAMGLQVGEKIEKVHGRPVANEHEFFEVMSENRTYCKLAVRDLNGEIRFVQRAIYEGERHELGLIFIKETPRFSLRTESIEIENEEEKSS